MKLDHCKPMFHTPGEINDNITSISITAHFVTDGFAPNDCLVNVIMITCQFLSFFVNVSLYWCILIVEWNRRQCHRLFSKFLIM